MRYQTTYLVADF